MDTRYNIATELYNKYKCHISDSVIGGNWTWDMFCYNAAIGIPLKEQLQGHLLIELNRALRELYERNSRRDR